MANDKNFVIKNGLSVGTRYLQTGGADGAGTEGYNLAGASYDSVSFSLASQDDQTQGLSFNNDGTKLYIVGSLNDSVYQYTLSTAFDLSTISYDSVSFSVTSQDTIPTSITFNNDGTKMYVVGRDTNNVYQYSLSTAFDLSTASYSSVSFSVAGQSTFPHGLAFNNEGTKMYMCGDLSDSVFQYSLSTAFDLSTASYDSVSLSVLSQDDNTQGIAFNNDGTKLYMVGASGDSVYQYSLSTAFDLSTASYDSVSFSVASQDTSPLSIAFNNEGTKMFMCGNSSDSVHQYSTALLTQTLDLSTGTTFSFTPSGATTVSFTNPPASGKAVGFAVEINGDGSAITWPTSVKWHLATAPTATATKELYTFVTTNGGTTYYGKRAAEGVA